MSYKINYFLKTQIITVLEHCIVFSM